MADDDELLSEMRLTNELLTSIIARLDDKKCSFCGVRTAAIVTGANGVAICAECVADAAAKIARSPHADSEGG